MTTTPTTSGIGGRSHIGAGSSVTGELEFPGTVELLGKVNGKVKAVAIVLEESGVAEGEFEAETIVVKGRFDGSITGGAVTLHSRSQVSGEIAYAALSIESGAQVNAVVHPRQGVAK